MATLLIAKYSLAPAHLSRLRLPMKRFLIASPAASGAKELSKRARNADALEASSSAGNTVGLQQKQKAQTATAASTTQLPNSLKHNATTDLGSGASVSYHPRHLSAMAKRLLPTLLTELPWEQQDVNIMGRSVAQPRLICYMADEGLQYTYSGLTLHPQPWSAAVQEVKAAVEQLTSCTFNSCLLNYYRTGNDNIAWHSDNELLYGKHPTIASVSFGGTRDFVLRHNVHRIHKISVPLASGDVLVMMGTMQQHWQHCVPKRKNALGPRVSLTFRNIITAEQHNLRQQQQQG